MFSQIPTFEINGLKVKTIDSRAIMGGAGGGGCIHLARLMSIKLMKTIVARAVAMGKLYTTVQLSYSSLV